MPFRCRTCDTLLRTDSNPSCQKRCDISRVVVIHFMHKDGKGILKAKRDTVNTGKDTNVTSNVPLYLACKSTVSDAACTSYFHAVTCLDCIDAFKKKE